MASLGDLILLTLLTAPWAVAGAALVTALARRFGFVPRSLSGLLALPLLACGGLGLVCFAGAVETMILAPARLQEEMLGERVAGPLELRALERFGFQDPGSTWRYRLSEDAAARLERRCVPQPPQTDGQCAFWYTDRVILSAALAGHELILSEMYH